MPPYSEFFFSFVCVDRPKWRTVSNFNDAVMLHLANLIFTDIISLIYLRGQSRENEIFPLPSPTYRGLPYKDDPIWGGGNLTRLFEGDIFSKLISLELSSSFLIKKIRKMGGRVGCHTLMLIHRQRRDSRNFQSVSQARKTEIPPPSSSVELARHASLPRRPCNDVYFFFSGGKRKSASSFLHGNLFTKKCAAPNLLKKI